MIQKNNVCWKKIMHDGVNNDDGSVFVFIITLDGRFFLLWVFRESLELFLIRT